jgi:hypothetical protein
VPKRKGQAGDREAPIRKRSLRSAEETYAYWTDDMMAKAAPLPMERPQGERVEKEQGNGDERGD